MESKKYRDAYVAAQLAIGIPNQLRALRARRNLTQDQMATLARMNQSRISELEKAGERRLTLETLKRIASALDVALEVRFVPFSQLIRNSEAFDPDSFYVMSFEEEMQQARRAAAWATARPGLHETIAAFSQDVTLQPDIQAAEFPLRANDVVPAGAAAVMSVLPESAPSGAEPNREQIQLSLYTNQNGHQCQNRTRIRRRKRRSGALLSSIPFMPTTPISRQAYGT